MQTQNILALSFAATECNGWPQICVTLDDVVIKDCFVEDRVIVEIPIAKFPGQHRLCVKRYGKTNNNIVIADNNIIQDQTVKLLQISVNSVKIPDFVIYDYTKFVFDDQIHHGSLHFGPNGTWEFEFRSPIITWLLDQKILHESKYNQDYQYSWSYKLGPDSVINLTEQFADATNKINQIYD